MDLEGAIPLKVHNVAIAVVACVNDDNAAWSVNDLQKSSSTSCYAHKLTPRGLQWVAREITDIRHQAQNMTQHIRPTNTTDVECRPKAPTAGGRSQVALQNAYAAYRVDNSDTVPTISIAATCMGNQLTIKYCTGTSLTMHITLTDLLAQH